jgi:hypothetical protein
MDWGSVPEWLSLLAIVGGVVAFLIGRRDASRSQASRVFLIVLSFTTSTDARSATTKVEVANLSDAPVFDVNVLQFGWGGRRRTWRLRTTDQWTTGDRVRPGRLFATIPPNTRGLTQNMAGLPPPPLAGQVTPPFVMVFRDGNGRRWVRWHDGRLNRLSPGRTALPG